MIDLDEGFVDAPDGSDLQQEMRRTRNDPMGVWSHSVVSCWYISNRESDTLWKQYAAGNNGIAICTTVGKLADSINSSPLANISTGIVQYRDPPQPDVKPGESYDHDVNLFFKGTRFADEKEYRILGHAKDIRKAEGLSGVYVETNLQLLFERILVSPSAPLWFFGLVISLVKKVAPAAQILRSEITNNPYTV